MIPIMRCSNSRLSCDPNQNIGIQSPDESNKEGRVYVMKKRIVDGLEVRRSSGNVYADLGLPNAEKLKIKTGLVIEIRKAIRRLELTQQVAAKRMGLTQPKVSDMMRGDFTNLSERKLMDCLNRLGYDIEIKALGHLTLAVA